MYLRLSRVGVDGGHDPVLRLGLLPLPLLVLLLRLRRRLPGGLLRALVLLLLRRLRSRETEKNTEIFYCREVKVGNLVTSTPISRSVGTIGSRR